MAIADTPHSRYMTAKFGSGLASRADAAGNHTLSTTVMDAYAQSGQAVPAELATQIQELNSITQNEAMLSQSSPSARAALAAGSYDPIATRNRAAQLEQQILSSSATARNAGAAAELQINQQRALELQLKNQMTQDTFGAARDANISTLSLQAEQARDQLTTIEDGRSLRTATDFVYQNGATVDDLYAAYSANDPAIMQQVFGTTDRRVAHGVLQAMQIDQSADTKLRLPARPKQPLFAIPSAA